MSYHIMQPPSSLIRNCSPAMATCDGMYPENCKVVQPSCNLNPSLGAGFVGNASTVGLIRPM